MQDAELGRNAPGAVVGCIALALALALAGSPIGAATPESAPVPAAAGEPGALAPPSPPAGSRLGWLSELAGRCWHQPEFAVDACYWQPAPDDIRFLSRNAQGLLGCGAIAPQPDLERAVRVRTWEPEARDPDETWWLSEAGVGKTEPPPPYPEGVGRTTVMTRPLDGRIAVRRAGIYGPRGPRAGEERIEPSEMKFVAGHAFDADDPDAKRCMDLDGRLARPPADPAAGPAP